MKQDLICQPKQRKEEVNFENGGRAERLERLASRAISGIVESVGDRREPGLSLKHFIYHLKRFVIPSILVSKIASSDFYQ